MTTSHVKIGLLALCLALLLAVPSLWLSSSPASIVSTDIAIEHEEPLTVNIARLASSGANLIEIGQRGSGSIAVHVPAMWVRQEVRGAPIASVTSSPQELEYVRWVIPSGATVRFAMPNPGRITLHNPSGIPLTVHTIRVNGQGHETQEDATIITLESLTLP